MVLGIAYIYGSQEILTQDYGEIFRSVSENELENKYLLIKKQRSNNEAKNENFKQITNLWHSLYAI